jgi:hypothetical protein
MIVEVIRYRIAEGQEAAFADACRQAQQFPTDSPHRLGCQLTGCLTHRRRYLLLIRWDSVDGHLQSFRGSPAFLGFMALGAPFFKQIEEREQQEPTGIESANGPERTH